MLFLGALKPLFQYDLKLLKEGDKIVRISDSSHIKSGEILVVAHEYDTEYAGGIIAQSKNLFIGHVPISISAYHYAKYPESEGDLFIQELYQEECENCGGQGVDPNDSGNGEMLCTSCEGSGRS